MQHLQYILIHIGTELGPYMIHFKLKFKSASLLNESKSIQNVKQRLFGSLLFFGGKWNVAVSY